VIGDVQWGTAPEWFAAIGTVGAFGATVVLLVREHRAIAVLREQQARAQAEGVSVFTRPIPSPGSGFCVVASNATPSPVTRVYVEVFTKSGDLRDDDRIWLPVLGPGELRGSTLSLFGEERFELRFTDAGGRHWCRNADGVLTQVAEGAEAPTWWNRLG
jgi:hypothetical protein